MQIKTLDQLRAAVNAKRSVRFSFTPGVMPAAFLYGMPANVVHARLVRGTFIYTRKPRSKPPYGQT